MPDQWQVTDVIETTDNSGKIPAWEVTLTRLADEVSLVMFLPKMAIENAAVTYGLTSADEAIDVIMHQAVLSIYEPDTTEANPWQVSAEQAHAQVAEQVKRCKREHAAVKVAAPARRAAARSAPDVLAPLRGHVRIDPVRCAALRLEAAGSLGA
ncbi:hypothetical protein [Streptosporangium sp. NPDC001681]|uniref:hypothetical protein n=1 Tax=Streptosporangium sp. NPDC001681 TaxID=3154395 RepID=UPI00331BE9BE